MMGNLVTYELLSWCFIMWNPWLIYRSDNIT